MNKRKYIIVIIILLTITSLSYSLYLSKESSIDNIKIGYSVVFFESLEHDNSVFNVQYKVGVENIGEQPKSFQLKIRTRNMDDSVYSDCIPEEFISRVITLMGNDGDEIELITRYQAPKNQNLIGCLDEEKLEVEVIEIE